ncbi:MAG: hypothetical protein IT464_12760 [Planctomycetes bacterium]|nr:hypothetical protein [Planctomycetota bacterium]
MALADGITTLFTTWADRNVQAAKVGATQRAEAIAVAVAECEEIFGTDPDETDVIVRNIGFVEAVLWLRAMIPIEVSADMERYIEKWTEKKEAVIERRKALESEPRKMKFLTTRIDSLYPFGQLPWEVR